MRKIRHKSKQARLERKILVMLAFFSVSAGLWENFRQLWLQDNGFSATDVSTITSLGLFISVGGILLVGAKLRLRYLKPFMTGVLGIKLITLIILFSLDASRQTGLIQLCTIIDILTTYVIIASVYPLITTITKSNRIYSKRKLVEYWFRDIGVLVGGLVLGQQLMGSLIDDNACLMIAAIFLSLAIMTMFSFHVEPHMHEAPRRASVVKYVLHSKLQICYLTYAFLAATSFAAALSLKMLVLTNYLDFSVGTATNYLLIVGLLSDVVGALALKYFTPRNDYLTMTLKFGIRLVSYIIVVLADNPFISLLAMTWSILISTAYEDVSDGYYINLVDNRYQLSYSTLKHVMSFLGEAVGTLICGLTYNFGIPAMFGTAAAITTIQLGLAYYVIALRTRRRRVRHSASRMRYNERLVED